jgi:tetratricopeptide (TPR) repeat protein
VIRVRRVPPALALVLALSSSSCGYFNAMYNANRRFDEARRLEKAGDRQAASQAYHDAIDRAAVSYRGHPDSRWADDALYLIGRSRFALGEYEAARAAFVSLLALDPTPATTTAAGAYIGASTVALGDAAAALPALDSALDAGIEDADINALALLWRARARFDLRHANAAWADLDSTVRTVSRYLADARIEMATRAVAAADTARFRYAVSALFADRAAAMFSDSIATLIHLAEQHVGPAWTSTLFADFDASVWPLTDREPHDLARVDFIARAGDTTAAIEHAMRVAGRASAPVANRARIVAARLELGRTNDAQNLGNVRAMLLPAIADPAARDIVRWVRTIESLVRRSQQEPLALFVAAEIARENLDAPTLARTFFLAYADSVPDAVWAPKALLAAASLAGGDAAIVERFRKHRSNVYVQAVDGTADPAAYETAELRLERTMNAIRQAALDEADANDTLMLLDSARADSIRRRGVRIDTSTTGRA